MPNPLDKPTAVSLGAFVDAAYSMYDTAPNNLTPPAFGIPVTHEMVAWVQMSDFAFGKEDPAFYGIIAQSKTRKTDFVLAIRGTSNPLEWWDNFHAGGVPFSKVSNAGHVAEGFDYIYNTLKVVDVAAPPPVAGAPVAAPVAAPASAFAAQIEEMVKRKLPAPPPGAAKAPDLSTATVSVVGHSLGSALATLYVLDSATNGTLKNPLICTFASPAVGNGDFIKAFNALGLTSWRIVNQPDLVPKLPPPLFGYVQVDALYEFNSTGKVKSSFSCAHSLATYLMLLDPALQPDAACQAGSSDQVVAAAMPQPATP